eukprot:GHVL01014919.1.p1 GENE.GHVL01014919.1~~GHVL01014919.1.p1  ORF type:complete len:303 (+),score=34.34 GHVL01014919.1:40-948(+)
MSKNIPSYYRELELLPTAKREEIRDSYFKKALIYHPDKITKSIDETTLNMYLQRWSKIQDAYCCLYNPSLRIIYDIRNGVNYIDNSNRSKTVASLIELQKNHSEQAATNMKLKYENCLKNEGLIIKNALYGNLRLKKKLLNKVPNVINIDDLEGPVFDITIQTQCLVEDKSLNVLFSSGPEGIYNPLPLGVTQDGEDASSCVYIYYTFNKREHEVCVFDSQRLRIPLRSHVIDTCRGPYAPSNSLIFNNELNKDKKINWLIALAATCIGFILISKNKGNLDKLMIFSSKQINNFLSTLETYK